MVYRHKKSSYVYNRFNILIVEFACLKMYTYSKGALQFTNWLFGYQPSGSSQGRDITGGADFDTV